jgi:AmmeMemoRadiSam system protein B
MRKPAVAGYFYEKDEERLRDDLKPYMDLTVSKRKVMAMVSPHAGIKYSGTVAGAVYSRIQLPRTFIILGPNHKGIGGPAAVAVSGEWQMPNGPVKINSTLAKAMMASTEFLQEDQYAHSQEHSLEVQLPFIQYLTTDFDIVPVVLKQLDLPACLEIGIALSKAIKASDQSVVIIASSDFTHYESQKIAEAKDKMAIDRILTLDPSGLYQTIISNDISMCGFIPTVVALEAALQMGAAKAELVKYMTSGDTTGDYQQVVGYGGIIIY